MDFEKLCNAIFALNSEIRYAGVIDDSGAIIAGGMKRGIDSIVDQTNEELYIAQTVMRKSMRQRFDDSMGKARFTYVDREKISILTFYVDKYILLITMEPDIDTHTVMDVAEDTIELINGNSVSK